MQFADSGKIAQDRHLKFVVQDIRAFDNSQRPFNVYATNQMNYLAQLFSQFRLTVPIFSPRF